MKSYKTGQLTILIFVICALAGVEFGKSIPFIPAVQAKGDSRYFLTSYAFTKGADNKEQGFGQFTFESKGFPRFSDLREVVHQQNPEFKTLVVLNLYEFKTKAEFDAWKR